MAIASRPSSFVDVRRQYFFEPYRQVRRGRGLAVSDSSRRPRRGAVGLRR